MINIATRALEPVPFSPIMHNGRIHLTAPNTFNVYSAHDRMLTLKYLGIIGQFTIKEKTPLHLDFSEVEFITAAASVMLFAEITRAQLVTKKSNIITISLPRDSESRSRFIDTGLFEAIKPGKLKKLNDLARKTSIFQSGTNPDEWSLPIALALDNYNLSRKQKNSFSRGVQEAMLNVIHHAYDNDYQPLSGIGRRWWHAIYNNETSKKLVLIIYDKGQGIPSSMSKQSFPFFNQGEIIRYVIPKGITRFLDKPERGKGTQDMIQAMEIKDNSTLLIYSDKGTYIRDSNGREVECSEIPLSVNGTLVEWQIPY